MITAISSKVSTSGSSPVISQSTHTIRFESEATNFWQSETADDPFYKKKTKQIWFRKIKNTLVVKTKQIAHNLIFFRDMVLLMIQLGINNLLTDAR